MEEKPITKRCCYCRRTYREEAGPGAPPEGRDGAGLWLVSAPTSARVSHGICPACFGQKLPLLRAEAAAAAALQGRYPWSA